MIESRSHVRGAYVTALLAACVSLPLVGCGSQRITADTSCRDYLEQPGGQRSDAAIRISSQLGVEDAGNPMWALTLDAACGSQPDQNVRQAFGR